MGGLIIEKVEAQNADVNSSPFGIIGSPQQNLFHKVDTAGERRYRCRFVFVGVTSGDWSRSETRAIVTSRPGFRLSRLTAGEQVLMVGSLANSRQNDIALLEICLTKRRFRTTLFVKSPRGKGLASSRGTGPSKTRTSARWTLRNAASLAADGTGDGAEREAQLGFLAGVRAACHERLKLG